jgi:hypothetical protein
MNLYQRAVYLDFLRLVLLLSLVFVFDFGQAVVQLVVVHQAVRREQQIALPYKHSRKKQVKMCAQQKYAAREACSDVTIISPTGLAYIYALLWEKVEKEFALSTLATIRRDRSSSYGLS